MQKRINALSRATGLKKTTIIEMCVKDHLPALEERYAKELAELPPASRYPDHKPQNLSLNDETSSTAKDEKTADEKIMGVISKPPRRKSPPRK